MVSSRRNLNPTVQPAHPLTDPCCDVTEAASEHRPFRQSDQRSFHRSDHRLRVRRSHAELEPVQTASCPQEALAVGHYSMSAEWRSGADRKLWRLGTGRVPFSSAVSQCPGHDSNALVRHALERGVRRASCGRWGRNRELVDRIQRCVPDQRLALRQLSDDLPGRHRPRSSMEAYPHHP